MNIWSQVLHMHKRVEEKQTACTFFQLYLIIQCHSVVTHGESGYDWIKCYFRMELYTGAPLGSCLIAKWPCVLKRGIHLADILKYCLTLPCQHLQDLFRNVTEDVGRKFKAFGEFKPGNVSFIFICEQTHFNIMFLAVYTIHLSLYANKSGSSWSSTHDSSKVIGFIPR